MLEGPDVVNPELFLLFDALALSVAAAIMDVQQHRIANRLTYPAMLAGLLLRSFFFGWHGAVTALAGFFLAAGIIFIFYAVRAMGAGDLKLMAAIGAFTGPRNVLLVLVATAIAGGVLAVIYAVYRKRLTATLANVGSVMKFHALGGLRTHPQLNLDNPEALRMPYGLAIAAGTLYAFITAYLR
jgi:prepilin peptidase CpaA